MNFLFDILSRFMSVALKESEGKHRELNNQLQNSIESMPTAYILWNTDSQVVEWNKAAEKIFGYSKEEILGKNATDYIVPEEARHLVGEVLKKLKVGEISEYSEHANNICKDGKLISCQWYNTPLVDEDDNIYGFITLALDITERKKLESQIQQAQKMESIGTLAGGIAHDFNNILFSISGYTDILLMDTPEDSPSQDSLKKINTSVLRAKALVKQIIAFSRQDANELILMKVQPVVKEVLKLIRSTISTTIEITQDIRSDCGAIKADPTQIHQIVMNLATNAYHAMEETGGELKVSLKEIELGEYDVITPDMTPGTYACLTTSDTGTGMDKKVTEKIFDPFFTTKEIGKGTGMGLSVVHGIVKSLGGAIQVYSEPGKGTEFKVYFPMEQSSFEKHSIQTHETIQYGTETILLVDDEDAIITMEKRMLERLGYQVTSRISSIEALEAFRAAPDKFDLVITDMAMPNMPGDKLSAELTKICPDIPVLLCTGFSETMSEEKAASLGIKGFLLKPIVMKDLAQKIREVLDDNKA